MKDGQEKWLLPERRLLPNLVSAGMSVTDLVETTFQAYNAARLREACSLLATKMLTQDCVVGLTIAGALTPAGLGRSCIIPLIELGFVDWIVSTGAILYHDTHFALNLKLFRGWPGMDDRALRTDRVIRIYDVIFEENVLFDTDAFFRKLLRLPEFQHEMSTAEFHNRIGKYLAEREHVLGLDRMSLLAAAYRCGVPVYTSSPGDSSIGMNAAALDALSYGIRVNPFLDVNETASIVYHAKTQIGKSSLLIIGGGSPKNFALQTEPQLQEVYQFPVSGHDYFIQVTDARPDTGGLSGATPSEAVTWGKINPDTLADTVVCYLDSTIALPILTAYVTDKVAGRPHRRLYDLRADLLRPIVQQAEVLFRED